MINIEIEGKINKNIKEKYIFKNVIVLYRNKKTKNVSNIHFLINNEEDFCILYSLVQTLKQSFEKDITDIMKDFVEWKDKKEDDYELKVTHNEYIIEDTEADLILIMGISENKEKGMHFTTYINFGKSGYSNLTYIYTYLSHIQLEMMHNMNTVKPSQELYPKSVKNIISEMKGK